MPEFAFKAKNGPVELIRGNITAASQQEAIRLIEQKGYVPIEVVPASAAAAANGRKPAARPAASPAASVRQKAVPRSSKVPLYEICVFTRQLAGLMRTHIPLLSALEIIKSQAGSARLKSLLSGISEAVRNGGRFSEALAQGGHGSFDARYIGMVRSGESGGSLDVILETLADYLEQEEELRGQIKAALAYPALIVMVGAGTLFFLFTWCLPKLSAIFGQTFATLPLPMKLLLMFCRPEWQAFFWFLLVAVVAAGVYFFTGGEGRKRQTDLLISKIPILGDLRLKADIARFCSTLSMLIENGISVHQAIEVTRPVLSNELLKEDLKDAQNRILAGEMMTAVLRESPHFPPFVSQMIHVGEESGQLVQTLREVARFYTRENIRGIKMLTSLIEPAIILVLSLVVGFVVAAIMLPIFEMNWIK